MGIFLGTVSLRLLAVPAESRQRHGGLKKEKKGKKRARPELREKRRKMKRGRRR